MPPPLIPLAPNGVWYEYRIGQRPRSESIFDSEAYSPPRIVLHGAEVDVVMGLWSEPFNWVLARRKHDRKRLVVHRSELRQVPCFTTGWPTITNWFNLRPLPATRSRAPQDG